MRLFYRTINASWIKHFIFVRRLVWFWHGIRIWWLKKFSVKLPSTIYINFCVKSWRITTHSKLPNQVESRDLQIWKVWSKRKVQAFRFMTQCQRNDAKCFVMNHHNLHLSGYTFSMTFLIIMHCLAQLFSTRFSSSNS